MSRIINGQDVVSPELAERVNSAVKKLHYQPNSLARALKVRESLSIGLVIPDIENPFFPALVRGVEDAARQHGYSVILCNTDGRQQLEEKYIRLLAGKQTDGILFTGGSGNKILNMLTALMIPIVILDRRLPLAKLNTVTADNRLGAFLAAEHLLKTDRRRIAFIGGPPKLPTSEDRLTGYQDALMNYGVNFRKSLVFSGDFTFAGGGQAARALVESGTAFDAVFATNDVMAIGVIDYLHKTGRAVPDDVAVVGYDDILPAVWYKPSLTTIRQPVYAMGQAAVQMLIENLNSPQDAAKMQVFEPQLVIRESSSRGEGH